MYKYYRQQFVSMILLLFRDNTLLLAILIIKVKLLLYIGYNKV